MPKVSCGTKIYGITIVAALIYCGIAIALYHLQEKLLFHKAPLPRDFKFKFSVPFEEVNIPMTETDTLNLIRFCPKDAVRNGVVIYFHGNAGNVIRYERVANDFIKNGYEIWIPDYPGY